LRKVFTLLAAVIMLFALSACNETVQPGGVPQDNQAESATDFENTDYIASVIDISDWQNILIAYFSATGNTRTVAEQIAEVLNASLFDIVPEAPYTNDDLNWTNRASRSITEQYDNSVRPAFVGAVENMDGYDIVFVGFPIWNGIPPRIIYTFLENYDFSGKTVVPFSTSNTTGISRSMTEIRNLLPDSYVLEGVNISRANLDLADEVIDEWLNHLNIRSASTFPNQDLQDLSGFLYLHIGDVMLTATLAENTATETLTKLLAEKPIIIDMRDFGGFEKVGNLGVSLPTSDERITAEYNDIMLFQGNQLVIFYAQNTWSYTPIGRINETSQAELIEILGEGNVTVTLSLTP